MVRWTDGVRKASALKPYERNAKKHPPEQIAAIAASMREFGFGPPVLIDNRNMILAGHGRILALAEPGMEAMAKAVPVRIATGLTETQKRGFILADNRLTEMGEWDRDVLFAELGELNAAGFNLDLTGFDLSDFGGQQGRVDPDAVPPAPKAGPTKDGDIWLCGDHRVLCGDSTKPADVKAALAAQAPNLMVTDPPYGVDYDPDWRNRAARTSKGMGNRAIGAGAVGKVSNDDRADWGDAWTLFAGNAAYVWHGGLHAGLVAESLEGAGFVIRSQIIWDKTRMIIGRGDYHWEHEPCWYAVRKGKPGGWTGDRTQTTIWRISHQKSETGHGTQKPVECMARPIRNNSKRRAWVYDPFIGSGTTMIACEMEGRRCIGIDIDPSYVDVAVLRWQAFTGKEATLEGDGRTFAEITEARKKKGRAKRPARSQQKHASEATTL